MTEYRGGIFNIIPENISSKALRMIKFARHRYNSLINSPITLADFNQERMPIPISKIKMNPRVVELANQMQKRAGKRLYISSGFRTPEYTKFLRDRGIPAEIKGIHTLGRGFDIDPRITGVPQLRLANIAKSLGANVEDLKLTPYHVHVEIPTKGSPTKLWKSNKIAVTKSNTVSNIMKKHVRSGNKTNGLVNNVLHNKKVNHTIASVAKKVAHLFKR